MDPAWLATMNLVCLHCISPGQGRDAISSDVDLSEYNAKGPLENAERAASRIQKRKPCHESV